MSGPDRRPGVVEDSAILVRALAARAVSIEGEWGRNRRSFYEETADVLSGPAEDVAPLDLEEQGEARALRAGAETRYGLTRDALAAAYLKSSALRAGAASVPDPGVRQRAARSNRHHRLR